jgi:hypothetical protein
LNASTHTVMDTIPLQQAEGCSRSAQRDQKVSAQTR